MESRLRLSELTGLPVVGPSGHRVGKVADLVVRLVDGGRPRVTGVLARIADRDVFISEQAVIGVSEESLNLVADKVDLRPFERRRGEVLLLGDVRGRAVIDVDRARLVRVNDLILERQDGVWHVDAILTGGGGLAGVLARFGGRGGPEEVPWSHVAPLVGHVPTAAWPLTLLRLGSLKPAEIADIVEAARHEEGEEILEALSADSELEADVFEELDETHRLEFIRDRSDEEAAALLSRMDPDRAVDLLVQLPQERRLPILERIEPAQRTKVRSLMSYGGDTAGGTMTNEYVALAPGVSASRALEHLRALADPPSVISDLFLIEEDRLVGCVSLRDVVLADPGTRLGDLTGGEPEAVYTDADLPSVAVHMADYNLASVPVIDHDGRLVGIITHDDVLEAILPADWRWRGKPAAAHMPNAEA